MDINRDNADWLLENAGSIIRYRTAVGLLGESDDKKVSSLKKDLLSDSLVQLWPGRLLPKFGTNDLHHSKSEAFENAMGKLYEFRLRKGMPVLHERTEPFRLWLAEQIRLPKEGRFYPVFYQTVVVSFLSMTRYSDDNAVNTWTLKRLETTYPFAKGGKLDEVYIPQDSFPGSPKARRQHPLTNPGVYPNDEFKLPWIHDINAFLHSPAIMGDSRLRSKVETIVDFILKPEYQKLHPGYGVIKYSGRYYGMGWSVHLPGYFESKIREKDFGRSLLRLNMMSRSRTAREHAWFKRSLSLLEKYRTEDGLIGFPRSFLPEKKPCGYWINGSRMSLEANRRTRKAIKCESTFRYLEIAMRNP